MKQKGAVAIICSLTLGLLFLFASTSSADLGLDSSDFGGKQVQGTKVSGEKADFGKDPSKPTPQKPPTEKPNPEKPEPPNPEGPDTSDGPHGPENDPCKDEDSNDAPEGTPGIKCPEDSKANSKNKENCEKVKSYVNLFTRRYQDESVDMKVKTPGGSLKIYRIHDEGKWQFEHDYNRLDLSKLQEGKLKKATLTYHREEDGLYLRKTSTIKKIDNQYRWQDKWGAYVIYTADGLMLETGNKRGVFARYNYENNRLVSINDRNSNVIFQFHYDSSDKVTEITDQNGRKVGYGWEGDNLTQVTNVLGHPTTYEYNDKGKLSVKSDETGRKFFVSYHPDGAVKSVISKKGGGHFFSFKHIGDLNEYYARVTTVLGNVREYWFDGDGRTIRIKENDQLVREDLWQNGTRISTDELGNRTVKTYDKNSNLIKVEHFDGSFITYGYDSQNNLISKVDELGIETRYSYNSRGQLITSRRAYRTADEVVTNYEYSPEGLLAAIILNVESGKSITSFQYDANENLVQVNNAEGGIVQAEYDYMGNIVRVTDPMGLVNSMKYDAMGNITGETPPDGKGYTYTYDAANRLTAIEDWQKNKRQYIYDYQDNLTQIKDEIGNTHRKNFDLDNRVTKTIDAEGKYKIYFYEGTSSRLSKIIDGSGNEIDITYRGYDNCGSCPQTFSNKPVSIKYPTFTRQFKYDHRGLVIEKTDITDLEVLTDITTYDKAGRLISVTNRSGITETREYDNLNRVTTITDGNGGKTSISYNKMGKIVTLTDAKGQVTSFEYDLLGNKTKEVNTFGNVINYTYDMAGRLLRRTDSKGQQVSYHYDEKNGRLASYLRKDDSSDFNGEIVRFSYDDYGRLTGYDDGRTSGEYQHNIMGKLLKSTINYGEFSSSTSYTYYRNGMKKSYTGPDGLTHRYSYTATNLLENIEIEGVGNVNYSDFNWLLPEKVKLPGVEREDRYDHFLRLTERKSSAGEQKVLDLAYSYNTAGNIREKKTNNTFFTYGYDKLQRLVEVQKNSGPPKSYQYDEVGNRQSLNGEEIYEYNVGNQLQTVGDTSFIYDQNGNTIQKASTKGTTDFTYDFENRLTGVVKDGVEAEYYYDPWGRRLSKEVNGEITWFGYSEEGLVAEFDASGKVLTSYSWKPSCIWSTDPLMLSKGGKHYFYHNDHLGAPQSLTDTSGKIVWQGIYDEFGEFIPGESVVENNLRLPGQYFDEETGLHYNWLRFYDPSIGRYLSADPIGLAGGMNLYAYAAGNPINFIDPMGAKPWWVPDWSPGIDIGNVLNRLKDLILDGFDKSFKGGIVSEVSFGKQCCCGSEVRREKTTKAGLSYSFKGYFSVSGAMSFTTCCDEEPSKNCFGVTGSGNISKLAIAALAPGGVWISEAVDYIFTVGLSISTAICKQGDQWSVEPFAFSLSATLGILTGSLGWSVPGITF